jgi:outer membrane protein assembly factor BamB
MAEREQEIFLPEEVDEQIDEYLAPSTTNTSLDAVAQHTVQALQHHFAPLEQDAALQRVWQRFEHRRTTMRNLDRARLRATPHQKRRYRMKQLTSREESSGLRTGRPVAAVILVALLVGSMVVLFQQRYTLVSGQPKEEKMFARVNNTLYRLDMKTHQPLWHFSVPAGTDGHPGIIASRGQVVNDTYYLIGLSYPIIGMSDYQGTLYALDVANGKVRWHTPGNLLLMNPVISSNAVYVTLQKDSYLTVEALDSASGAKKWEHHIGNKVVQTKNTPPSEETYVTLIAGSDKAVYGELVTPKNNKSSGLRFALSAQDGNQLWQKNEEITNLGGVDQGFLVDGVLSVTKIDNSNPQQQQGSLVGYNAANGEKLWSKQFDGSPEMFTTILHGIIYLGIYSTIFGQGESIYAFSAKDGTLIWRYRSAEMGAGPAPIVTEKGIYLNRIFSPGERTLIALDTASGKVRWTYNFHDNSSVIYFPAADNDKVYLSLPGNVIQILRASDGKQIGSFKVNRKVDPFDVFLQLVE